MVTVGVELEMCVIGAFLLMNSNEAKKHICRLTEEDFSYEPHRHIFRAIRFVAEKFNNIDPIVVSKVLTEWNLHDEVGGLPYLFRLQEFVPSVTAINDYIDMLIETNTKRQVSIELEALASKIASLDGNWKSEVIRLTEAVKNKLARLSNGFSKASWDALYDILVSKQPLSTGLKSVDDVLCGGFSPSELVIVCARPSVGKSAFLVHLMCTHFDKHGLFLTYEMSVSQLMLRVLARITGTSMTLLKTNKDLLAEKIQEVADTDIKWIIKENLHPSELETFYERLTDMGMKPSAILIDYLQIVPALSDKAHRYQELGELTKFFKSFAMRYEIPVIVAAQLRREAEDRLPKLRDLRESGDIEQDADVIIGLHRPKDQTGLERQLVLSIMKNRQGDIGNFKVNFRPDLFRFTDLNETYEENEDGEYEKEGDEGWVI